jgi:hypothetical protein
MLRKSKDFWLALRLPEDDALDPAGGEKLA